MDRRKVYSVPSTSLSILFGCHWEYIGIHFYSIGFLCWIVCRSCNEWSSSRRAGGRGRPRYDEIEAEWRVAAVHWHSALHGNGWQYWQCTLATGHWLRHIVQNNINEGHPFREGSSASKSWEMQQQQCPDEDRVRVMMMGWCGRPPLSRLYTSCCTPQWSQWSPHRHSVGDGGRPRTQPRPRHTLASHSPLVSPQSSHHPIITSPPSSDL